MTINTPTILALDFDGVICDGMIEYFQAAWRTYCQIWLSDSSVTSPTDLSPVFSRLRPVIETGWEMPILIRALLKGVSETQIIHDWANISKQLLTTEELNAAEIGAKLDYLRDRWIAEDLIGWLNCHRFYPGVPQKLQKLIKNNFPVVIISTKEGRFIKQLLQQENIEIPEDKIYGKELQRTKSDILKELAPGETIWFVEDRLKTLQAVEKVPELAEVQLFLADWGYNTVAERKSAGSEPRIKLLNLAQFDADFADWI